MKNKNKNLIAIFLILGFLFFLHQTSAATVTKTLYAWVKDAAGNVSTPLSDTVDITLPDEPANTYYVSYSTGLDTNNGTSESTPWKTIAKVNSQTFTPGASILFKKGDTWTGETLTVPSSGNSTSPVTFGAYGSGANPIFSGFTTVTAWTNEGNGIYSKVISAQSTPNMVTVDGVNTALGRYPNNTHLTIDSHSGINSITDAATPSSTTNWTGAIMMVRLRHWLINRCPVTAHSGTTLTCTNPNIFEPIDGFGFFFENDVKTLDLVGEWAYRDGKFYMYFGGNNPDTYIVKVSTIDKLINIVSKNYITINSLSLQGANKDAIFTAGNHTTVSYTEISFAGDNGIKAWTLPTPADYLTVDNSEISHIQNRGIMGLSANITIKNSYIHDVAMLPGMGNSLDKSQMGISLQGTSSYNNLVEYNRIDTIGYNGMSFVGNNSIVRYNYITNYGYNLDDGAGIYTAGNSATGRKIYNNIIINNFNNTATNGTTSSESSLMGIYHDDNSANIETYNNTIADVQFGMYFHGSHEIEANNNTIYNTSFGVGYYSTSSYDPMRNNNVKLNTIFAPLATQYVTYHITWTNDVSLFGDIDNNYYLRPLLETNMFKTVLAGSTSYKTLAQWQTYSSKDLNSHTSPVTITDPNNILFEYNATTSNKVVSLGSNTYVDVTGATYTGSVTLLPYTSIILIKIN